MKHYLVQYEGPHSTGHACAALDPEGAVHATAHIVDLAQFLSHASTAGGPTRVLELDDEGKPLSVTTLRVVAEIRPYYEPDDRRNALFETIKEKVIERIHAKESGISRAQAGTVERAQLRAEHQGLGEALGIVRDLEAGSRSQGDS